MGVWLKILLFSALILVFLNILLPIVGVMFFSLANRWDRTIWPEGYTLAAYRSVLGDTQFWMALYRSFVLAISAIGISALLVIPALLAAELFTPGLKKFIEGISLSPFVVPSVLFALGLVEVYAALPIPFYGTPLLLALANATLSFPLMFRAVENTMTTAGVPKMVESAMTLGANVPLLVFRIILPNLLSGIISGSLLVFSMVLSEFALANLIVGGSWPTLSVYLFSVMRVDGQAASVLSVFSVLFAWLLTGLVIGRGVKRYGLS